MSLKVEMWEDPSQQRPSGWEVWITLEGELNLASEQPIMVSEQDRQGQTVIGLIPTPNTMFSAPDFLFLREVKHLSLT